MHLKLVIRYSHQLKLPPCIIYLEERKQEAQLSNLFDILEWLYRSFRKSHYIEK